MSVTRLSPAKTAKQIDVGLLFGAEPRVDGIQERTELSQYQIKLEPWTGVVGAASPETSNEAKRTTYSL